MSIGLKLKNLIDYREMNVNQVAKNTNISPQTIYGIIKRDNTKVDIDILQALADYLDVRLDYFSTGSMDKASIDESEVVAKYNQLDDFGKKAVQLIVDAELDRTKEQGQ